MTNNSAMDTTTGASSSDTAGYPHWEFLDCDGEGAPPSRSGHTCALYQDRYLYVFGGFDGTHCFDDLWCLDLDSKKWEQLDAKGDLPSGRASHSVATDDVQGLMYIFGGSGAHFGYTNKCDLYAFHFATQTWQLLWSPVDDTPSARYGQSMVIYNEGLYVWGGKNKLMAELGLMKDSAEKLIKQYHTKAPFVKQLMDNVSRKANDRGKIRTLLGRACHFDLWQPTQFGIFKPLPLEQARKEYDEPLKRAFTYKALNKLIQGSAADMTKKSMVALYENGIIPHIQIHDEVDISVESPEKAEQIIEIMESAVELKVPNKVDYEQGNNWGDIK